MKTAMQYNQKYITLDAQRGDIKMIKQSDKTFQDISLHIRRHLEERDWIDNKSRDLAISISLEASELLEHYQWTDKPVGNKHALGEELADILIYAFQFAQANDIDIVEAIEHKLEKAAQKYPAEAFKNKSRADREKNWIDAKLKHRKAGL
jgi:NTP pyrophosphatase (non-canonical NTP hydrolase)